MHSILTQNTTVFPPYHNIGKRDILIFPKFNNIEVLQNIRKQYDRLASCIAPHITLAFPFNHEMTDAVLIQKLTHLLQTQQPFHVTFQGVTFSKDGYIFLNCVKGCENIIELHSRIDQEILPFSHHTSQEYIPHITLGTTNSDTILPNFSDTFTTIIDTISVERIGEQEESILIRHIPLGRT